VQFVDGDEYCFYTVLWIEMGRADCRRGLGRIELEAFDKDCPLESGIDIVPG